MRLLIAILVFVGAFSAYAQNVLGGRRGIGYSQAVDTTSILAYFKFDSDDTTTVVQDAGPFATDFRWDDDGVGNVVYNSDGVINHYARMNQTRIAAWGPAAGGDTAWNFDTNSFSITGWFRRTSAPAVAYVCAAGNSGTATHQYWVAFVNANPQFVVYQSDNVPITLASSVNVATNVWTFFAVSYQNNGVSTKGNLTFMLGETNAVLMVDTTANNSTLRTVSANGASIGAPYMGDVDTVNYFFGDVDEFSWWKRVLSTNEMNTIRNSGRQYPF